jgi:putative colanic acid biosynthesis acetyltransferase WcaF
MSEVRNDLFDHTKGLNRGRSRPVEVLWYICKVVFFLPPLPWPSGLRRRLLVAFGAKVGKGLYIRPGVNIHFPWKLTIGDHCWIGEDTVILNLAPVTLNDHVAIAHQVYLAAAGHDIASKTMAYQNAPIVIERGCWLATRAFVGPGVTIGEYAVVAAGAIVVKDVASRTVVGGNPAKEIAQRVFR